MVFPSSRCRLVDSTEAVSLLASVWFGSFIFALLSHPLLVVDRRMSNRCHIFADLAAGTSCVIKTFGALCPVGWSCLGLGFSLGLARRWSGIKGHGGFFETAKTGLLLLFGFVASVPVGVYGSLCKVICASTGNAEDAPAIPRGQAVSRMLHSYGSMAVKVSGDTTMRATAGCEGAYQVDLI